MTEYIVFPNAENITILAIRAAFTAMDEAAGVHKRPPTDRTPASRFVTVRRTGGPRHTLVTDAAQLTIEAWGTDEDDAQALSEKARAAVKAMAGTVQSTVQVYFVNEFNGPANDPDPISSQSRFVQTVQVSMRGAAA